MPEIKKDSLIKKFIIEEQASVPKYKVTFIVVNDVELIYYTSSVKFIESLKEFENERFIIDYVITMPQQTKMKLSAKDKQDLENKIVRIKLPKKKKA